MGEMPVDLVRKRGLRLENARGKFFFVSLFFVKTQQYFPVGS